MAKEKICKHCEHSYGINSEKKVRCVYHDKYPKPSDCCGDWKERSDELINRQMAKQAVADAESILLAFAMVGRLPAVEAAASADRPQGEWKHTSTYWVYCSVCGQEPPNESNYESDFCPNCGARMRK